MKPIQQTLFDDGMEKLILIRENKHKVIIDNGMPLSVEETIAYLRILANQLEQDLRG